MSSQDGTTIRKEQEDECVKGKGGGRQSLKHIDGDVPVCVRNKGNDDELKLKKTEKARGEGGGRQWFRPVNGNVPMCMRNQDEENGLNSKEIKEQQQQSGSRRKQRKR